MKRVLFVAVLAVLLLAAGAVAAFAAPGGPGFGMMGRMQGVPGGYGMMRQGGFGHMNGAMMGDDLEELLGISHAEIHAAHVAGKSLVEIAAAKGVSEEQLIKALLDGRKAALDQAVEAGRVGRDAADQMLKVMETNMKAMVNAQGMGSMRGIQGMMGTMRGMMGGRGGAGPCHGAPAEQGGVRNNAGFAPSWLKQG